MEDKNVSAFFRTAVFDSAVRHTQAARDGRHGGSPQAQIAFNRQELSAILNLYGRMVAAGEWRDYALDFTATRAVFSIFRRTSEAPLFQIVKDPSAARKQGQFSVISQTGWVMKRGQELSRILAVLEPKPRLVVS